MIWGGAEKKKKSDDCYFCTYKVKGYSSKTKKNIAYPNLPSALLPIPHGPDVPVPSPPTYLDDVQLNSGSEISIDDEWDFCYEDKNNEPQVFGQSELNDLVRDLGLAKESAQLLSSRLKSKNLLAHGTSYSWYRHREKVFTPYFDQENDFVYCTIPKDS